MDSLGRIRIGLSVFSLATVLGFHGTALAQSSPATPAPSPAAPASAPATAPAKKPTVNEMLALCKPAPFDFADTPITEVLAYIAKAYDFEIVNQYPLKDRVTMKVDDLKPREAINILNTTILAFGYTVVESVRGEPLHVVLTIVPTKLNAGTLVPVFYGSDPAKIPEGDAQRTQVMPLAALDPDKARDSILAVVGAQATITVNASTKTLVITDSSSHVHTAAALLQMLEKQAAENK